MRIMFTLDFLVQSKKFGDINMHFYFYNYENVREIEPWYLITTFTLIVLANYKYNAISFPLGRGIVIRIYQIELYEKLSLF